MGGLDYRGDLNRGEERFKSVNHVKYLKPLPLWPLAQATHNSPLDCNALAQFDILVLVFDMINYH